MISNEARWFYEGYLPSSIEKLKNSMFHSRAEIRSDYYLLTKGCDDIGIKLREGRLEIKWRKSKVLFSISKLNITGKVEQWIRWGWNDDNSDRNINLFESEGINQWIKVEKNRSQKKFYIQNTSFVEIPYDSYHYDCAMEITEIKINENLWWSLGFDLLAKDKDISFLRQFIEWQLGNQFHLKLNTESSYGYPEWLSKVSNLLKTK